MTNTPDKVAELRHALVNPLAALLTEVQLMLSSGTVYDAETRQSLQEIEALALRMRAVLKSTHSTPATDEPRYTN